MSPQEQLQALRDAPRAVWWQAWTYTLATYGGPLMGAGIGKPSILAGVLGCVLYTYGLWLDAKRERDRQTRHDAAMALIDSWREEAESAHGALADVCDVGDES